MLVCVLFWSKILSIVLHAPSSTLVRVRAQLHLRPGSVRSLPKPGCDETIESRCCQQPALHVASAQSYAKLALLLSLAEAEERSSATPLSKVE